MKLDEKIPAFKKTRGRFDCAALVSFPWKQRVDGVRVLTQGLSGSEDGRAEAVLSSSVDAGEDAESHGGSEGG